ncbi:MAG: PAS domain-containing protein [Nisaea sp.]|uniref:PAS domain-containing protein n=1 Tax=Nisaea sp. TaxID=2024842 RepID=UPI001B23C759|nr:PAS domain-containing protein [Nisaea sp.]MBO6560960.1 PAS domain-containing protein [Nisaea sp.]
MARPEPFDFNRSTFLYAERISLEKLPDESLVRQAHTFWRGLVDAPALPARSDFTPLDVPRPILPWLFIMEVLREPGGRLDYRYRLAGTSNVSVVNRDPTSKLASEVFKESDRAFMLKSFDITVTGAEPTFWDAAVPHERIEKVDLWRGLFPLAEDRMTVDTLLGIAVPKKIWH